MRDLDNIGVAVGFWMPSCVQAEIHVVLCALPVTGRHLRFLTRPDTRQCLHWSSCVAQPRKHRYRRWNVVIIMCARSGIRCFVCTFGPHAAIFDFPLPVWSDSILVSPIQLLDLTNVGVAVDIVFYLFILSRSWDISISGLVAATLDFPLPVWFRLSPSFPWVTGILKYRVFSWKRLSVLSTSLYVDSNSL